MLDRNGNVVPIPDAVRVAAAASLPPAASGSGASLAVKFTPYNSGSWGWSGVGADHGATPEVTPGTFEIETFTHNWLGVVLLIVAVYFVGRWIVKGKGRR
jgi:hypothetical protein